MSNVYQPKRKDYKGGKYCGKQKEIGRNSERQEDDGMSNVERQISNVFNAIGQV